MDRICAEILFCPETPNQFPVFLVLCCDITDHIAHFVGAPNPEDVSLHIGRFYYRRRVQFDPEHVEIPIYLEHVQLGTIHVSLYTSFIDKIRFLPHNIHGVMQLDEDLQSLYSWGMQMQGTMLPEDIYIVVRGICTGEPVRLKRPDPEVISSSTMVVTMR